MSYKKSIKGNGNEASEEFSHNRITVNMGSSGIIAVCFLCCLILAAIIWMIARQGTLFSWLITLSFVGLFVGAGIVGGCFLTVRISDMLRDVRVNKILAHTIVSGEVVAYRNADEEWDHLSAEHVRAGIPQLAPVTVKEIPSVDPRWDAVLDLRRNGLGMQKIAQELKVPYNRVRDFLNKVEGNQGEV